MRILVVMIVNIVVFHTEEYLSHGHTIRYNHVRGSYPVYSVSYLITMNFFQKWLLPTIQVHKAFKRLEDGNLPGGIETAMLYSIFYQSVMDLNRPLSDNFAENKALRAMVAHAKDDTMKHLSLSRKRKFTAKQKGC